VGRASKAATEHLMARVFLTKATSEAAASDDYQQAASLAETVINDYNFHLLDDFADVFEPGNENNAEVIWAVQYSENPIVNQSEDGKNGNSSHLYFNFPYDQEPGLYRTIEFGLPWPRFRPTKFTYQEVFNVERQARDLSNK